MDVELWYLLGCCVALIALQALPELLYRRSPALTPDEVRSRYGGRRLAALYTIGPIGLAMALATGGIIAVEVRLGTSSPLGVRILGLVFAFSALLFHQGYWRFGLRLLGAGSRKRRWVAAPRRGWRFLFEWVLTLIFLAVTATSLALYLR
jgi:hypothetical protein